ncbi:MAG: glycosyltransferase family 25 protein [Alcaligenaceae bacterium]|nr:glycosyltransferase family 25 protein [Alcaligenaceae bacterium]
MKIFVINMKTSVDRRARIQQELLGFDYEFFVADNLKEEPNHFIYSLYNPNKTKKYKGYQLTVPELGVFASHISLWRKCIELDESILILEDNIEVSNDLLGYLDTVKTLADKYGMLKLCNLFDCEYKVVEGIDEKYQVATYMNKTGLGAQAYVITPRVAQVYLDFVPGFFEPVDDFMEHEWRTKQTVYNVIPNLVNRADVSSTIGRRKVKDGARVWSKIIPEVYRCYIRFQRAIYNKRYK